MSADLCPWWLVPAVWGASLLVIVLCFRATLRADRRAAAIRRARRGLRGTTFASLAAWEASQDARPGQPHHPACQCEACYARGQAEALLASVGLTRELRP